MAGWRLETAIVILILVAALMFVVADVPLTLDAAFYWIAAMLIAPGLICAKRAWIEARARRGKRGLPLAIGAALLLGLGLTLAGWLLTQPPDLNNGHPL